MCALLESVAFSLDIHHEALASGPQVMQASMLMSRGVIDHSMCKAVRRGCVVSAGEGFAKFWRVSCSCIDRADCSGQRAVCGHGERAPQLPERHLWQCGHQALHPRHGGEVLCIMIGCPPSYLLLAHYDILALQICAEKAAPVSTCTPLSRPRAAGALSSPRCATGAGLLGADQCCGPEHGRP